MIDEEMQVTRDVSIDTSDNIDTEQETLTIFDTGDT